MYEEEEEGGGGSGGGEANEDDPASGVNNNNNNNHRRRRSGKSTSSAKLKLPASLSLLVSDCLRAYLKRVYRVEFKYAAYGENYYDLPGYRDAVLAFNRLVDEKK